jgi:hypothetical protein
VVELAELRSSEAQAGVRTEVHVPSSFSALLEPDEEGSWRAIRQPV